MPCCPYGYSAISGALTSLSPASSSQIEPQVGCPEIVRQLLGRPGAQDHRGHRGLWR